MKYKKLDLTPLDLKTLPQKPQASAGLNSGNCLVFPLEPILNAAMAEFQKGINPDRHGGMEIHGQRFPINTRKLITFFLHHAENKFCCANPDCGLTPSIAVLRQNKKRPGKVNWRGHNWFLSIYGINQHGHWIEFTHDHVLARGLGGSVGVVNTVPMCAPCNNKKSRLEAILCQTNTSIERVTEVSRVLKDYIERITGEEVTPTVLLSRQNIQVIELDQLQSASNQENTSSNNLEEMVENMFEENQQRWVERYRKMMEKTATHYNMDLPTFLEYCEERGLEQVVSEGMGSTSKPRYAERAKLLGMSPPAFRFFKHLHNKIYLSSKINDPDSQDGRVVLLRKMAAANGMELQDYIAYAEERGRAMMQEEKDLPASITRPAAEIGLSNEAYIFMRSQMRLIHDRRKHESEISRDAKKQDDAVKQNQASGKRKNHHGSKSKAKIHNNIEKMAQRFEMHFDDYKKHCEEIGAAFLKRGGVISSNQHIRKKAGYVKMTVAGYWVYVQHRNGLIIDESTPVDFHLNRIREERMAMERKTQSLIDQARKGLDDAADDAKVGGPTTVSKNAHDEKTNAPDRVHLEPSLSPLSAARFERGEDVGQQTQPSGAAPKNF